MTEIRDFVYIRADPDPLDAAPMTKEARKDGFYPERRDKTLERVHASVAASGRPKLNQLLRKLDPSSALIVWRLDALGRDAADVLKTIQKVNRQRSAVHCIELTEFNLCEDEDVLRAFKKIAKLDRKAAEIRDAMGALGRDVAGGHVGRPPSLDMATRAEVRARLKAGETVLPSRGAITRPVRPSCA